MVTQDELFDDLLNFTKSVKNAKTDEESSQLLKNFQAEGLEGKIDYENGIRPFSAKDARQELSELKLDMITIKITLSILLKQTLLCLS